MMKQFAYVVRYLLKGRGNSLIKVISLTLGLVVSLVLYTQIAFELSYDSFYPDKERIYKIGRMDMSGQSDAKEKKPVQSFPPIYAPMPGGMKVDIKGVEEAAMTIYQVEEETLQYGDSRFKERVLSVDEGFLRLFGLPVLSGDPARMKLPHQVFLSRSAAGRMFGDRDPVGEMILFYQYGYKKLPVTVAGVFEDIPENASFELDVLLSIQTLFTEWKMEPVWGGNDNYCGYVKLQPGVSPEEVEAQIPAMMKKYYDFKPSDSRYSLSPVTTLHKQDPDVRKTLLILGILASSLLIVSAMNYVLISISSLVKRSRLVGIYKACGATNGTIFTQFMMETVILIAVSLFLSFLLVEVFRGTIEELTRTSVSALFSPHNLWVTGLLLVVLILIAGVIPARLFAVTPATQVFRSVAGNKRYWKNILLFIQFVSITAMSCMLFIVVRQYNMMINKDWGYTMENRLYARLGGVPKEQLKLIRAEIARMPSVIGSTYCTNIPLEGMNGDWISGPEKKEQLFLYKLMGADRDFFDTFEVTFLSGTNFTDDGMDEEAVIVNETFIRQLEKHNFSSADYFRNMDGKRRIAGVVKDFQLSNLYKETMPLLICSVDPEKGIWWSNASYLVVEVDKRSSALLKSLNQKLFSLTHNENLEFKDYKESWDQEYTEARLFRNTVIVSSVLMLLITLLGLVGYVDDEIFRRHKEIAIRKINGASVRSILLVISKDFGFVVVPAMVVGASLSFIFARHWLQQFVAQVSLPLGLFVFICLLLSVVLLACICFRSWKAANEDPANSLKVE